LSPAGNFPGNDVAEGLQSWAANPGQAQFWSAGVGTTQAIRQGRIDEGRTGPGLKITHVPYRTNQPGMAVTRLARRVTVEYLFGNWLNRSGSDQDGVTSKGRSRVTSTGHENPFCHDSSEPQEFRACGLTDVHQLGGNGGSLFSRLSVTGHPARGSCKKDEQRDGDSWARARERGGQGGG